MRVMLIVLSLAGLLGTVAPAHQLPRDQVRPRPSGSAVVHGVVTSRGSIPEALRRVRVSIDGLDVEYTQTAITADDGSFRLDRLPAGSYTLRAVKDAYLPAPARATRRGTLRNPVTLRAGEHRRVDLQLARGAVITGRVHTTEGEAAVGAVVTALEHRFVPAAAERRLVESGQGAVLTDDRGVYRIYGLPPGDYFVMARPRGGTTIPLQVLTDTEIRAALAQVHRPLWSSRPGRPAPAPAPSLLTQPARATIGLTPIYHPGTPFLNHAARVHVAEGETRSAIDIDLDHVALANIDGAVTGPMNAQRVQIMLSAASEAVGQPARYTTADIEGRFAFRAVPPGT